MHLEMNTLAFTAALFVESRHGSNLSVHGQMNGQRRCGTYTMEYYSAIKKSEIMPFAATWTDPEIIILNNVRQKDRYHITYMWNLIKNDTNKLIYETETDSQISKSNIWLPKGKHGGKG